MKEILLYEHGGSLNHGCEALVRTITGIAKDRAGVKVTLSSYAPDEDRACGVDQVVDTLVQGDNVLRRWSIPWIVYQFDKRFFHSQALQDRFLTEKTCLKLAKQSAAVVAVGGDNYCYRKGVQFWPTDRAVHKLGVPFMLWGCSIEPKDLDAAFVKHLDNFDLLCCRESLSYDALVEAGLGAKARLVPDPAFTLETIEKPLPEGFLPNNTVGVNVSPMIISNEGEGGVTMANYVALIRHILDTTDMAVALIPHVVWSYNDDREPLRRLYEQFKDSGRVVLIEDADCRVLKGYISRLRFFVGARTHSTIAAYSTCVPTLVVGYSVKAKGIAHDLFGSYEPYVLPVQELREPGDLAAAFARLMVLEDDMRCCLQASMPAYIESAYAAGDELRRLLESK
ncbi:MAG: polysaccharide pyruvyl transferase family protein [Butyricicoccus sp.]|nr:polysaccharide pyruvyl transferase family protein [Butyricicoccus sp.]